MMQRGLVCLLLASMAWAQTPNSTPGAAPANNTPAAQETKPDAAVAPDAAVITIQGLCDGADKTAADCKTIVTKAQFEHLVETVAPKLPPPAKKQFANRYANALSMSKAAEKEGLDKTPKFDEMMQLTRMQILQQLLGQSVQEKASEVSDKDIEDYYNANQPAYEEFNLLKISVPRTKDPLPNAPKLSDAMQKKHDDANAEAMKKLADTLRTRAAAGEDFTKLQAEAYTAARKKMPVPDTKLDNRRRNTLPPDQSSVFELKAGEVSPVIEDEGGYLIYKVVSKDEMPLDKVRDEIHNTIRGKRIQDGMQALQKATTTTLSDAYFGVASPAPGMMPMGGPGRAPQMTPPPPPPVKK